MQTPPYTAFVPRKPKTPRPDQGARLLAFRKEAGLTQAELADLIGENQENISFWERSDKPPRSDVLPELAKALNVSVEDLLGQTSGRQRGPALMTSRGPAGQLQLAFEEVRKLPRRQQQKVVEFVLAFVEQHKRKAS